MGHTGTIYRKSIPAKIGKRFFALLMVWVMIFGLPACTGEKGRGPEEIKPVAVERKPEPQGLQTANEATAIALRQYVYARLLTETFLTEDTATLPGWTHLSPKWRSWSGQQVSYRKFRKNQMVQKTKPLGFQVST